MAWYHVGGCDCPMGCCDCGDTKAPPPKRVNKKEQRKLKAKKPTKNLDEVPLDEESDSHAGNYWTDEFW